MVYQFQRLGADPRELLNNHNHTTLPTRVDIVGNSLAVLQCGCEYAFFVVGDGSRLGAHYLGLLGIEKEVQVL